MKALAKHLPGKRLTMIQSIVTLLLVIVICCVTFGTIFTIPLAVDEDTQNFIQETLEEINDGPVEFTIPEKVDVNIIFLVKSIGAGVETVKSLMSGASDQDGINDALENVENIQNNKDKLLSQDTVNFAAFIGAIYQSYQKSAILGYCYLLLVTMAFIFPIVCLFKGLIALFGFLFSFTSDWGKAFSRVSKAIYGTIKLFPVLLLLMILVPEIQFGWAIYTILGLCAAALVLNFTASRLKYYEGQDYRYLNILQILSACSMAAFLMFFFGIAKSGVIAALWDGINALNISTFNDIKENIITFALASVFVSLLTRILDFMPKCVTRLACMSKSKSSTHIPSTAMGLISILALYFLTKTDFKLELGSGKTAFIIALVGVVLMFVIEILLKVIPNITCRQVTLQRRREIVTGAYYCDYIEETTSVTEITPVEEAPAEVATTEEATTEVTTTEEATAEVATTEEATAEVATTEEATAEVTTTEEATAEVTTTEEAPAEVATTEVATTEEQPTA